jgi:hypothetical protein
MGLVQDFKAIPEMVKQVRRLDRAVKETEGKDAKSKRLTALRDERAAWASALAYLLQERLCDHRPGKAVPFVDMRHAIAFANKYDEQAQPGTIEHLLLLGEVLAEDQV